MKKLLTQIVAAGLLLGTLLGLANAQQKLAQTGYKFLNVGTDARSAALSGAMTSLDGGSSSLFYNPAGMARMTGAVNVSMGKTLWIADIDYSHVSAGFPIRDGDYGVVGLSLQAVDYGEMVETIRSTNEQGYLELGKFNPTALALGLSYSRALNEKFSVGGNVKYARQFLGTGVVQYDTSRKEISRRDEFKTDVIAFDIGILYRTGFKSLNFGMVVRNFSKEIKYVDENFQLPLTFKIGVSMDMMDLFDVDPEEQSFLLSIDAEHPRDFPEIIRAGGEYTIFKLFALRGGYVFGPSMESYTIGLGALKHYEQYGFGFDYAYTPYGELGNIHRFSLQFSL